jgi:hypothetical protein
VRWTGSLIMKRAGTYKFALTSDDGSKLWVDGSPAINNDGLHGMATKEGTNNYGAGAHAIRLEFFEKKGLAGMVFKYKGSDTSNNKVVVPQHRLRKLVSGPTGPKGLQEEVFYFSQGKELKNLKGRKPNVKRVVRVVNYAPSRYPWPGLSRGDHFAVRGQDHCS